MTGSVAVRVPASSTIRASRRVVGAGTRVTFSGRIRRAGQPLPPRGLVVVLQGRAGGVWQTFADTRTTRAGRWKASYRFRGRPGTYPVRLRIRRANTFPFELGYSPTTTSASLKLPKTDRTAPGYLSARTFPGRVQCSHVPWRHRLPPGRPRIRRGGVRGRRRYGGAPRARGRGQGGHDLFVLPAAGRRAQAVERAVNGAKLALEQAGGKAGDTKVTYEPLDDSTAQAANWTPEQTSANARKAAQDDSTAIYLGEFNSGATAVSLPILNEAGIAQISPSNTAVGLTSDEPGANPGEPDKYYPTGSAPTPGSSPRTRSRAPRWRR